MGPEATICQVKVTTADLGLDWRGTVGGPRSGDWAVDTLIRHLIPQGLGTYPLAPLRPSRLCSLTQSGQFLLDYALVQFLEEGLRLSQLLACGQ